jgi:hypothetical protein
MRQHPTPSRKPAELRREAKTARNEFAKAECQAQALAKAAAKVQLAAERASH